MKRVILSLGLVLAMITLGFTQKIEIKKALGNYRYSQNGRLMSLKSLAKIMENHPQAFDLISKARTNKTIGSLLGFAGGALIGWPLGASIRGKAFNWNLAGTGAALIVVGIPISLSAVKRTREAVGLYNASLDTTYFPSREPELELVVKGNGMGVLMRF